MASKDHDCPGIIKNPARDYCTGRLLVVANELLAMGYDPRAIAEAALDTGLDMSRIKYENHFPYLRLLENLGRDSLKELQRIAEWKRARGLPVP